ncbi:MAG: secretin N-terminal domain-containing protein [Candidatus Zapsychrus exili]|nr:secretin N-terminal domain-containing protein [Candidatus Zapsychrus exili]
MINHKCNHTKWILSFTSLFLICFVVLVFCSSSFAADPKPIVILNSEESILDRMERSISLDVRDMNIIDVIKFLALKGEFNIVVSPAVEGRSTVLLKRVSIHDALDIIVISNHLAYKVDKNIVQVMSEIEYEALVGKKFSDQREVEIIRLNYSKPTYVLAALDNIKSNIGKIIIDEDTGSVVLIDTPEAIVKMKESLFEIERPLKTFVYEVQYAEADALAIKLRSRIDAKAVGSITPDERSNKLVIRAFPDRIKEVRAILKELDESTKEVLVDAKILSITLKPRYDAGIDWQLDFRNVGNDELEKLSFENMFLNKDSMSGSDQLYSNFGQIAVGDFDVDNFEMSVRSLEQVSDTKILSNPQLLVTNNQEAKIHIGDTVPYIISTTSGTGDNAVTSEDVRFVDVGIKLHVMPTINDEGFVTMRLKPEISTVVGTITSQGGGIPQVNKTEVETTVMVKDGNTIAMGGLKKDNKIHTKKGFPVLMDLPVLGFLFGRTSDDFEQKEIVIFITPHIVTGRNEDMEKIKGEIKPFKSYSTD